VKVWWIRTFSGRSVLWSTEQFIDGDAMVERTTDVPVDVWTQYEQTGDELIIDRYLVEANP
jgi:hypothetical protein